MKLLLERWRSYILVTESAQQITNMGYPSIIASLFFKKFGNKAPLFAKWFKDYYTSFGDVSDDWWGDKFFGFSRMGLADWISIHDAIVKGNLEEYEDLMNRWELVPNPESFRDPKYRELLEVKIERNFNNDTFFNFTIIKDYLNKKFKDLRPYKKLTFDKAVDRYNQRTIKNPENEIMSFDNGYRWTNVGAKCEIVGKKMKNCGSTGVMSMDEDRTMLVLVDKYNNPKVVATYSPNENRISGVEGKASTASKPMYDDYVIKVAKKLGAEIDTQKVNSKSLRLKWMFRDKGIKIDLLQSNPPFSEYYLITMPDGTAYYSNFHGVAPKEQVDSITDDYRKVFNYRLDFQKNIDYQNIYKFRKSLDETLT